MRPNTAFRNAVACWILLFFCLGARLAANCEAGAYKIHTRAQYLDDSSKLWFFQYEIANRSLRLAAASTLSDRVLNELFDTMSGGYLTLSDGTDSCSPPWKKEGDFSLVTTVNASNVPEPVTRLVLSSCFDRPHVPGTGYAFYDREDRKLRLGSPLPVEPAPALDDAERWIRANLFKLGLNAEENRESPIHPEDVEAITFGHTKIGDDRSGFMVTVAVLRLRNLDRLFSENNGPPEELQGRFADFPVLFVVRPGKEPLYIGDGSWCSGYRLQGSPRQGRQLGPLERFKVSAAYDVRGHGTPDLLVVNESIVYYFSPQGDLLVVDYPPGE